MRNNRNANRWCQNKPYGYLMAFVGVAIAFSLRFALHPVLEGSLPLFFFQVNTILIAFYFGIGPALLTMALSAPLLTYFFMAPFNEFTVFDQRDITTLFVYFSYTLITGILVELLRREQYNAQMAMLVSDTRFKLMLEGDHKIRSLLRSASGQKGA
jgi:K+-sensing histidine kinase KdpD